MSTLIRPLLSINNKYHLEKHRTYELRHFAMQYHVWKKMYAQLNELHSENEIADRFFQYKDPTAQCAIAKEHYVKRIAMIEDCCKETDSELWYYILQGVTRGCTYESLKMKYDIPCSRDTYYDRYRKFFWLLDKTRE